MGVYVVAYFFFFYCIYTYMVESINGDDVGNERKYKKQK